MSGGYLAARDPIRGSLKRFASEPLEIRFAAFKHAINTTKADVSTDFGDTSAFSKNATVCEVFSYTSFKYLTPYGGSSTLPWMSLVSPVKRSTALYSPRASMEHGAFSALTATNTVS